MRDHLANKTAQKDLKLPIYIIIILSYKNTLSGKMGGLFQWQLCVIKHYSFFKIFQIVKKIFFLDGSVYPTLYCIISYYMIQMLYSINILSYCMLRFICIVSVTFTCLWLYAPETKIT